MDTQLANLTLREAYRLQDSESKPYDIPWIVWLLENPDSPLPFPGQIYLREHDYLHIIFGLDRSSESEAFLVGFAMGLDLNTRNIHLLILILTSFFLYPKSYKFSMMDIRNLNRGFLVGRMPKFESLRVLNFELYLDQKVSDIRNAFGLQLPEPRSFISQTLNTMSNRLRSPFVFAHLKPP
ncbi:hypothetical protein C1752_10577 [Acaryochloris thomasi RCC1774]|uniref:Uncharacterized protein n=1 Tax=Acaryochloris thomasi RCC1774 TaxID=1764569 RepID=A0A2W1J8A6_9CYAN|nr:hypothetical protein [Acaryochloris thomasi]PZD70570.1 hypothetical protein C1752_10577 [Acaryochloris thomasi RCC1774]